MSTALYPCHVRALRGPYTGSRRVRFQIVSLRMYRSSRPPVRRLVSVPCDSVATVVNVCSKVSTCHG